MKQVYIKDGKLYRTCAYDVHDVIEEFVCSAMKDYDLSLPEREEDETDDDYENSCLDDRHDMVYEIAELAKYRFLESNFGFDKEKAFNEGFAEEQFDELLGEITWEKLSDLKDYMTES